MILEKYVNGLGFDFSFRLLNSEIGNDLEELEGLVVKVYKVFVSLTRR